MNKVVLASLTLVFLASCHTAGDETSYMSDMDNSWQKDKTEIFEFEVKNFKTPKDIVFVIKNNDDYPYSNLRIISSLSTSQGIETKKRDTLNYILSKPNGEWLGKGIGSVKETMFLYLSNYKFPANGVYKIKVKQAMRQDTLRGIEQFGIKIK